MRFKCVLITNDTHREDNMFDKLTAFIGAVFFGGWALSGAFFFVKAFIDFIT